MSMSNFQSWIKDQSGRLDERINFTKTFWIVQGVARFFVVLTFLEDAARMAYDFQRQTKTVLYVHDGHWSIIAAQACVACSFLVQATSSMMICLGLKIRIGCVLLLLWSMLHPFMYKQQYNLEFVLETISIMGGLCILLSCTYVKTSKKGQVLPIESGSSTSAQDTYTASSLQLIGRIFLVFIFAFQGFFTLHDNFANEFHTEEHSNMMYIADVLFALLVFGCCTLVIVGLKARWVGLAIALTYLLFNAYEHPFWWYYLSDESSFLLSNEIHGFQRRRVPKVVFVDHQTYYFFQAMSTVGAVMLLALHGPGTFSHDEADGRKSIREFTSKGIE